MFDEVLHENVFSETEREYIRQEYSRAKDLCYLDHVGCPLYPKTIIEKSFENLSSNVYGNPHSGNLSSKFCLDTVDQVRFRILQHFNTSASEYSVIFTSGATASLKLVAESFVWSENGISSKEDDLSSHKSYFAYLEDNHTSVLGMREVIGPKGVEIVCLEPEKALEVLKKPKNLRQMECKKNSLFTYSAQSNFSGVKYPLEWISQVKSGALDFLCNGMTENNWYCLLDAASYVSTNHLDLSSVKPDFVAISFYKIFGFPTGLGALLVRNSSSHLLQKSYYGGGTVFIALSKENSYVPRSVIHERFEDGTINFQSIISLTHGFDFLTKVTGIQEKISKHCFQLARYAFQCLVRLHHSNGNPVAVIYSDTTYENIKTQGNILNFNLLRPNGEYVGFAEVLNLANLHGIHLRTGCFCNPGACRRHLKLTTEDVKKHFESGHVCGDDHDLVDGQPTGSIRISFGPYTSLEDVDKLLHMVVNCFAQKPILQHFPKDWKFDNKLDMYKLQKVDTDENSRCYIYFWYENVGYVPEPLVNPKKTATSQSSLIKVEPSFKKDRGAYPHLSHMFLYPVKSCGRFYVKKWELTTSGLKYDREWMITNSAGVAVTQKTELKLCLIKPIIDLEENKLILTYNGYPNFSLDLQFGVEGRSEEAWLCSSKVCGDQIRGYDCGDDVSHWLSNVLGRQDLRLIRQKVRDSKSSGPLTLSNQAQYLMINKKSVDWLADKLEADSDCKKESMLDRFRSNFVISQLGHPFEEQQWKKVIIGEQEFKVDGPCGRCQMICIDQDSGTKTKEPLTTLATSLKGKLKFGIYLSTEGKTSTTLSVGDPVSFQTSF